jgi:hypothetical protein
VNTSAGPPRQPLFLFLDSHGGSLVGSSVTISTNKIIEQRPTLANNTNALSG